MSPTGPKTGVYRIRSLAVTPKDFYLTADEPNVGASALDVKNIKQLWRVSEDAAGNYMLSSVVNSLPINATAPTSSERDFRVFSDSAVGASAPEWTIQLPQSGGAFLISAVGKFAPHVIDLSIDNRIILWEVNQHPNQWWDFQPVSLDDLSSFGTLPLKDGTYRIKSKGQPEKYLYLKGDSDLGVKGLACDDNAEKWDVKQQPNGAYVISNGTAKFTTSEYTQGDSTKYALKGVDGNDTWTLERNADGTFTIGAVAKYGPRVVDLSGDNTILWERNGNDNQKWIFEDVTDPNGPCAKKDDPKNPKPPPEPNCHDGNDATKEPRPCDWSTYLSNYNIIFMIDDSSSMVMYGNRWDETRTALQPIADTAFQYGANTVSMQFLNSSANLKAVKKASTVVGAFDANKPPNPYKLQGTHLTPTARRMGDVLNECIGQLDAAVGTPEYKKIKPFDIIFLTDGFPQGNDTPGKPADVFEKAYQRLQKGKHSGNYVGVQIVQVGDDPQSIAWMNQVMQGNFGDIVDTTPYNGEPLTFPKLQKILLGAVQPTVRGQVRGKP